MMMYTYSFFLNANLCFGNASVLSKDIAAVDGNLNDHNHVEKNDNNDDDDEMEQEDMFVEPHDSFEFRTLEWGGPRRGGRLPEPTRYGDWERKGRCTDF